MKTYIKKVLVIVIAIFVLLPFTKGIIQVGDNTINKVEYQVLYDLDYPQTQLNNHTLREVFEGGNLVTYDLSNDWRIINATGTVTSFTANARFGQTQVTSISGLTINDKLYTNARYKADNLEVRISIPNGVSPVSIPHTGSNNYENIKGIFRVTATGSISYQISDWRTSGWTQVDVQNVYLINLTSLGLSALTVEQMDYWFNVYQTLKRLEGVI